MATREIITLQIGHYANYVGTHLWNIQESSFVYEPNKSQVVKEINNDVLFREGQNIEGEVTYTPRTVIFDLKGSLNNLRQEGTLYDVQAEEDLKWNSDLTMHKMDTLPKNEFLKDLEADEATMLGTEDELDKEDCQTSPTAPLNVDQPSHTAADVYRKKVYDLDDKVTVWSDFLRVHLHPRSIHLTSQYQRDSDQPFDVFCYGQDVYKHPDSYADIEDRLHFFAEECDHLQGFQLLVDSYDGFGGVAAAALDDLTDDYGSKAIFSLAVSPAHHTHNLIRDDVHRLLNTVLSYDKLIGGSTAVLPLSLSSTPWKSSGTPTTFPHLQYKPELQYHTSGILAASIDCMSAPYRLHSRPTSMLDMLQSMTFAGRKMLALHTSLPFLTTENSSVVETLLKNGDDLPWQPLTMMCASKQQPFGQSVVWSGGASLPTKSLTNVSLPGVLDACTTHEELMQIYLKEMTKSSLNSLCFLHSTVKVEAPFPSIFKPHVNPAGKLGDQLRPPNSGVEAVPVMTSLQSTSEVCHHVNSIMSEAKKINIRRCHKYLDSGLEEDDYKEIMNNMEAFLTLYDSDDLL